MKCRTCGGNDFALYLDLGHHPPADQFLTADQVVRPVVWYPLQVYLCRQCGLSQLGYVVPPEILYQQDYPYESSTTASGRAHFAALADSVVRDFSLHARSLAVDIGSNVGVLLNGFARHGVRIRGIDPAANIAALAEEHGVPTVVGFFSPEIAKRVCEEDGRASVITATNVFAHVDDLELFMDAVDLLLDEQGVLVIEAPSLLNLIRDLEYDTIYHEHLSYLSVRPLIPFFRRLGMELFDVQEAEIHGGSIRLFAGRSGRWTARPSIAAMVEREERAGIHDLVRLTAFARDVERNRDELRELLYGLKRSGARLAAVSAPAKGMTLLNYARLGRDLFDFATEKSTLKIGRYTPGAHIPVRSDAELTEQMPDYALLLAWNFAKEIMSNLRIYTERGGRFIMPIPVPRIVDPQS